MLFEAYNNCLTLIVLLPERNELQKDIEQLCMQQAGPSILGVATRMHFQRFISCSTLISKFVSQLTERYPFLDYTLLGQLAWSRR